MCNIVMGYNTNFFLHKYFIANAQRANNARKLQAAYRQLRIYNRAMGLIARSKARLEFRIQWLRDIKEELSTPE